MSVFLLIKGVLFVVFYLNMLYFTGSALGYAMKEKYYFFQKIAVGFVVNLALTQFLGWCLVAFRMKTAYFVALVGIISVASIVAGILTEKREKPLKVQDHGGRTSNKINMALILAAAILLLQLVMTGVLYRADADDSFYVSNVLQFSHSSYLNLYDSSMGIHSLGTVPMYDFQIWESLIAVYCRLFQIQAAVMMHTVLVSLLLVISACAYLYLGNVLFQDKIKAYYFYTLLSVYHLMGGNTTSSQGSFLLGRLWQGKAVYLHIAIPVMMAFILDVIEKRNILDRGQGRLRRTLQENGYIGLKLLLCILAGVALNPTSLYIMGFLLLFMMVAVSIKRGKMSFLLHILPGAGIILFFTAMIYYRTSQYSGQIEAASAAGQDLVSKVFQSFWRGERIGYIIVYLCMLVIILKLVDIKARVCFIWTPLLLLLFVWNPIAGNIVAGSITKVPSYWRVFWLVPAGMAIAYSTILLAYKMKNKYICYVVLLGGTLLLAMPGKWMFAQGNQFRLSNNAEKIPSAVITFGDEILSRQEEGNVVLACPSFATTIRQKYPNMELTYSRHQYILDLFKYRGKQQEAEDRIRLMHFTEGKLIEKNMFGLQNLFEKYQINWIVLKTENTDGRNYLEHKLGIGQWDMTEKYVLYHFGRPFT